jgi:nitrite reductase (NO-forming)
MGAPDDQNAPVTGGPVSRRALLKGAGLTAAGGAGAVLLAACTPAAAPGWTFTPATLPTATAGAVGATASAAPQASAPPSAPAASFEPARPVTTDDISLHPREMPDSPDYALYGDGRYERLTRRTAGEPLVHEVHFTSKEVVAEVVPGATMEYWTFDGRIPGPMIRARVGDSLDFFLENDATSLMPHNVDFHAVTGPGGGAAKLDTLPGNESRLKVKLLNPGIYIYHCAFPDVPMHISHGMYGLIVVEPPEGLPPVDREYYLMQSEFYTDRGGRLGYSQFKDAGHLPFSNEYANEERPTFVVWNGRPESIAGGRALGVMDEPILAGQTVRLFVGNIGPNLVSSFHVIGEIFDTVYVEGSFDLRNRNVQSTLIPAGGAVGVEFKIEVPGTYLLVDHSIFRIHKGIAGELVAGGDPAPEIFESIKYDDIRGSDTGH